MGILWVTEVSVHVGVHAVYAKALGCKHLGVTVCGHLVPSYQYSESNFYSFQITLKKFDFVRGK